MWVGSGQTLTQKGFQLATGDNLLCRFKCCFSSSSSHHSVSFILPHFSFLIYFKLPLFTSASSCVCLYPCGSHFVVHVTSCCSQFLAVPTQGSQVPAPLFGVVLGHQPAGWWGESHPQNGSCRSYASVSGTLCSYALASGQTL